MQKGAISITAIIAVALTATGLVFTLFKFNSNATDSVDTRVGEVQTEVYDNQQRITANETNIMNIKEDISEIKVDVKEILRAVNNI